MDCSTWKYILSYQPAAAVCEVCNLGDGNDVSNEQQASAKIVSLYNVQPCVTCTRGGTCEMVPALCQTVYGNGNDVKWRLGTWENGLIILQLQVGMSSQIALTFKLAFHFAIWLHLRAKNQITISPFFSATCNHYLQGNTIAPYPVLDTSLTRSSIRPSCYSFYRSYFILHPRCNLHPNVNLHISTFLSPPLCPTI